MKNKEVAKIFYEISEILSLSDENSFRIRAYEKAAQVIESLPQAIEDIRDKNELKKIPGIGEGTAEKILEYLSTGRLEYLDDLKKKFPEGLIEIMEVPGMGPKKAKHLYDELKISNIRELKRAAEKGELQNLPGFGTKTEDNILRGIELKEKSKGRILLSEALSLVKIILDQMQKNKEIKQISPAGSLRRKKETIGDIDILCTVEKGKEKYIIDKFTHLPIVDKVLASGGTKASIVSGTGFQVDLRVVKTSQYGSALQYFTGSKEHNIKLRELANKKKLTINEYGVFKIVKKDIPVAGKTEEGIYKLLGLRFVPPQLREDRGEIESALKNQLPALVEERDIKGDIHIHSNYSDGTDTIEQIASKAKKLGLQWVIICDHSQSLKIAGGVPVKEMYRKIDEIKKFNSKHDDIKLLCGAEVDILADGKLDYDDSLLKELDFVIAAIHTGFKQTEEQITNRITKALEDKYVDALSHPTGRLINKRSEYKVNMQEVLESAKKHNVYLEINAFPERLDLNDIYCKKAKEMGITMAIGTDAHHTDQIEHLPLGVYVAQRGWLEKKNLINTLSYKELIKLLEKHRRR